MVRICPLYTQVNFCRRLKLAQSTHSYPQICSVYNVHLFGSLVKPCTATLYYHRSMYKLKIVCHESILELHLCFSVQACRLHTYYYSMRPYSCLVWLIKCSVKPFLFNIRQNLPTPVYIIPCFSRSIKTTRNFRLYSFFFYKFLRSIKVYSRTIKSKAFLFY